MTLGLPKPLAKIYKRTPVPQILERKLFRAYAKYLRLYVKIWTWHKYDRKNPANLYPLKLLWIPPQRIEYGTKRSRIDRVEGTLLPRVLDGDWDQEKISEIEERIRYRSMQQHFIGGLKWDETELYQKLLKELRETGSTQYGGKITSREELGQIFENIDNLYREIKENGYKTQKEIKCKEKIVNAKLRPDHYTNQLNEVVIDIGRNGEILLHENRHRLYIAQILGLEKIPVRILLRHEKWQDKRNRAVKNPEVLPKNIREHKDIRYLIK